jgi:hypothetical protein
MAKPGFSRTKFRRISIFVNMAQPSAASTASIPLISVWNSDSGAGANIWNGQIKDIANLFRNLGYDTVSSYSPPRAV